MKKTTTYWLLAATMTLAGCASDNDLANNYHDNDVDAVKITATRAAANTATSTPLAEGETFRLINTTRQDIGRTTKYEAVYQVTSAGITPAVSNNYVVWQTGNDNAGNTITQNVFNAVIPSDADYDSFTLPTNQSSADNLKYADWQTATATYPVTAMEDKPTISLNFEHQHSNIVITISDDAKSDLASLSDIKVLGTITPYYNSTAKTIQAIVKPATTVPNTYLLTFKDATGEPYTIPFPSSITSLDKGKQYNFTLTGGHNALTISSVSVTDWSESSINLNGHDDAITIPYVKFTSESEVGFNMTTYGSYTISGLEYSVNNGTWTSIPSDGISDIQFGGNNGYLRLRGKNPNGTATSSTKFAIISFTPSNENSDAKVACTGDIRTLLDYSNYKNVNTSNAQFRYLFNYCTQLTSAPELPATTLADWCYFKMFYGCTSLTTAPELPATKLANSCYSDMFNGCTSLTTAPELKATTLASNCYFFMFYGCIALTTAPKLPATTLDNKCYSAMFYGCTSLKTAPELPATTLADWCYFRMFEGCTSLTKAPELPATTLDNQCYSYMFSGCKKLESVTMLATNVSASDCLYNWLDNAGTDATSRTLKVASQEAYNNIASSLPKNWKEGASGTTVTYIGQ